MDWTGRTQRRAAATALAGVVGALLVASAAVGQMAAPEPATPANGAVGEGIAALRYIPKAPIAPVLPRAVVAELHDEGCVDPVTGGPGLLFSDPDATALLIGDSQSAGAVGVSGDRTWPRTGLRNAGFDVRFVGAGGTGFTAANGAGALAYPSAFTGGQWVLPCRDPALIVVQGGGNDASLGASDAQVLNGADVLVSSLNRHYPTSEILLVGVLAEGVDYGCTRRCAVDWLLGAYAQNHGVPFISAADWLTRHGVSTLRADDVHLTQAGHDRVAAAFTSELNALGLTSSQLITALRAETHYAEQIPQ
jgi:acyl-CoA thioesterase-1